MLSSSALRKFAIPLKTASNSSFENSGMDRIESLSSSVVVAGIDDESRDFQEMILMLSRRWDMPMNWCERFESFEDIVYSQIP